MLEWLVDFARNPTAGAQRVPGVRAPIFIRVVPVHPPVYVTFLLADEFHTIKVIKIRPMP
jgi:hypothetical protein